MIDILQEFSKKLIALVILKKKLDLWLKLFYLGIE